MSGEKLLLWREITILFKSLSFVFIKSKPAAAFPIIEAMYKGLSLNGIKSNANTRSYEEKLKKGKITRNKSREFKWYRRKTQEEKA